jgi:hypothetical protein
MAKTYTETRTRIDVIKQVDDGKGGTTTETTKKILMEDDAQGALKKLTDAGENASIVKTQTFTLYKAETLADISQLSGSESNAVAIWNRGAVLKQQADAKAYLADDDFQPVEGAFDLAGDLASESERGERKSPKEKALSDLMKLSAEDFAAVLEEYRRAAEAKGAQPTTEPQLAGASA